ncbi:MAG TPA: AI-2E family transporter [Terriglobales bacterium]|nr:AI-2E family transporter [Terriglobales bacterium]
MAVHRINPPHEEQALSPELQQKEIQERRLRRTLQAAGVAHIVVGVAVVLVICYLAKLVLVTLLVSVLLAFMLEPLVGLLRRARVPRSVGALIAVLLLVGACWVASYFFYNRAVSFIHELPGYSQKIRDLISPLLKQTKDITQTTQKIIPPATEGSKKAVPVKVENTGAAPDIVTKNVGIVTELALTLSFIPFLVYFMLSWLDHGRDRTVQLFRPDLRSNAFTALRQISVMMRGFILGNFIMGLFMSIVSTVVFGLLGVHYFYFLGFISGFLSLVPYLGVALALIPPLVAGLGTLSSTGFVIVVATVLGLHVFSLNVLYPKFLGKRLQLNPLVVTMALLIWGWIWGAPGLVLAVPVTGAIKIVCDNFRPLQRFGEWMGD